MTDPIADYLTAIRNAIQAKKKFVDIKASNLKRDITQILLEQGYIKDYANYDDGVQGIIRIFLKYDEKNRNAINQIDRASTPGLRKYAGVDKLPRVKSNLGIAIMSTSKGVMTNKRAKTENVGGEVLCYVS
ncbi:MAG TPA: 30S ribosomal protein S8 [bacterium]|nr:30S ribosomal protein S8 [bacterium]HMW32394.1 30S ribosomal protein S8 [bacterium]HMW36743.1 30S ribosomal protein S8 [bacterium]HMY37085.1 30S ribosomal protein S8 [bacterium]HMZ04445.1 30S ribosomal protein S8 [bacterium]